MRETITQLRVAECVELRVAARGCTRDAIFLSFRIEMLARLGVNTGVLQQFSSKSSSDMKFLHK
jgi:hypothetical protein